MFQGQREFHVSNHGQLTSELARQNNELEKEFGRLERDKLSRWNVKRSTASSVTTEHGDMMLAAFNGNAVVLLPASDPAKAGHPVRIAQAGLLGQVTVAAQSGNLVNGSATTNLGGNIGWREYVDDGAGGWWGPAT